jgi:hypothetical protein
MGSIKTDSEVVVVTLEAERLLDEPVRMIRDGKFQVANIRVRHVVGWVLWSMMAHKMPNLNFAKMKSIDIRFDKDNGTFIATIEKQL